MSGRRLVLVALAAVISLVTAASAAAAAFNPGDVVVYRVGNGTAALANTGNPVFLDEYSPTGTTGQSIALPTAPIGTTGTTGFQGALIASGTATSEGLLALSPNGEFLTATGYDRGIGGAGSISSTTSATVPRTVAVASGSGTVDTSTVLNNFASGNNPRSAVTTDGTNLWVAGAGGGLGFATLGAASDTQISSGTVTNFRQVAIFGNQLYASSSSGAIRLATVGSTGPTGATGQAVANLPGFETSTGSPYSYYFADLNPAIPGNDTLYVADDGTTGPSGIVGQIQKYALTGSPATWTAEGAIGATGARGLAAFVTGDPTQGNETVTLYATTGGSAAAGGGSIYAATDTGGQLGTVSGTATTIASAPYEEAFRGISLAPVSNPGTIQFSAASQSVNAAAGTVTLNVTRTGGSQGVLRAAYNTADGSATAGNDYTTTAGYVTFADGDAATKQITVPLLASSPGGDAFSVALSNPSEGALGTNATQTVTINPAPGSIEFSQASQSVDADAGSVKLNVTRVGGSFGAVSANYATADGTALAGTDYTAQSGTVTFADGVTGPEQITVPITATTSSDSDFTVNLSSPSGATLGTPATETVDITHAGTFSFDAPTESVGETAGSTTIQVDRTGGSDGAATVSYTVGGGTAVAGTNYTAPSGTVSFAAGQTTAQITVPVLDDGIDDADTTLPLTLTSSSIGSIGAADTNTLTIQNQDVAGAFAFDQASESVPETGGTAHIQVDRTGGSAGPVTVDYTVGGTAVAGSNFTAPSGSVSFVAGQTTATIAVPVLNDAATIGDKTVVLTLTSATANGTIGTPTVNTLTILITGFELSPTSLAFGTQALDTLGAPQTLTVTDQGTSNITIGHATVVGTDSDDFIVTTDNCSNVVLRPGDSCTFHLRFGPSDTGTRTAALNIPSDDPANPIQVQLTGTGGSLPTGPTGPTGGTGAQGSVGATGGTGSAGTTGATGSTGTTGSSGQAGAQGPQGPSGTQGSPGPQGPAGQTGATGPQGSAGETGATGPQGVAGETGSTGPQGSAGETGATGPSGTAGLDGSAGPQGPQGDPGETGPGGPAGSTGAPGPAGAAGADGVSGSPGPAGSTGPNGAPGAPGTRGPAGPAGPAGPRGARGPAATVKCVVVHPGSGAAQVHCTVSPVVGRSAERLSALISREAKVVYRRNMTRRVVRRA